MPDVTRQFKALANKNRLAIFEYLRQHEAVCVNDEEGRNVGDIAQQFELALSTVSHHLQILKQAGLVDARRDGKQIYYSLRQETIADCCRVIVVQFAPEIQESAAEASAST